MHTQTQHPNVTHGQSYTAQSQVSRLGKKATNHSRRRGEQPWPGAGERDQEMRNMSKED